MVSSRVQQQRDLARYIAIRTRGGREMVDHLLHLLRADGPFKGRRVSQQLQVDAAVELLNRLHGRPPQATRLVDEKANDAQVLFIPFRAKELPTPPVAVPVEEAEVVVREQASGSDG